MINTEKHFSIYFDEIKTISWMVIEQEFVTILHSFALNGLTEQNNNDNVINENSKTYQNEPYLLTYAS